VKRIAPVIVLALILTLAHTALTLAHAEGTAATTTPDHITLTWTGSPATTMTVTWRTDTSVSSGLIEFGKNSTALTKHINATCTEFRTDLGSTRLFRATLTGLSPNTKYYYRVGDGAHWSTTHSFTTANLKSDKVKFLVFGDSQSVPPYSTWQTTIHNAYKANPDARFVINVGDLVDVGQNGAHWNAWFDATAGVIDSIPEMPTLGNHETNPPNGTRRPVYWDAQFAMPQNGPDGEKNQAYSYDYGPVHIVVLDSQQAEQKKYGDIFSTQKAWLDKDLSATMATWKIVCFHKAPYQLHKTRSSDDVKSAFCSILESHHVDLVFNGHDHGVGRTYPINNGVIEQKPSQGTIYYICGRSGSKVYRDLEKKPWDAFFYNPLDQPNYLVVGITGKKLTVRAVKQDGTPIDSFFIDKAKDTDSDCQPARK